MSQFAFTHGFLAEQLRVQRATVTESLAGLQKQKIIKYGYGSVELLHAKALEKKACECFQQAKAAVENFLADIRSYTGNELSW